METSFIICNLHQLLSGKMIPTYMEDVYHV